MKVLFYTSSLSRSGGGVYSAAAGLAHALADQGIEVVAVGSGGAHFEEDRPAWRSVTLEPHGARDPGYGLHSQALTALRRHEPDLVHIHGIWSASSIYGLAATRRGVPTVVSPHGMLEPWILARRPLVKRVHAALFERPLLRRACIHALNEAERINIGAFLTGADKRTFVVPNGIPEVSYPDRSEEKHGALFLGRLHSKKQVIELIRAWRALGLPESAGLTVAGWGDPGYEAGVRQAAEGAANVSFVGPLHGEAKATALSRARFFILPSLSEGLPMAVLEAIQHGCIPVITAECNFPELVFSGIALPMERDFSDFREVIAQAFGLPEAEAARRSAEAAAYATNYAWSRIARAMIEQYQRCIANDPRS